MAEERDLFDVGRRLPTLLEEEQARRADGRPMGRHWAARKRSESARVAKMAARFGRGPEGATCGGCQHLQAAGYRRTYFKCGRYGVSMSAATDWRKKWPACGAFLKVEPDGKSKT